MALLALIANLTTRWRYLHQMQILPPDGATCIATLPRIALLTSSVGIELISSSARVTSVKSAKGLRLSQLERTGPIDRTPGTPGSDKKSVSPIAVFRPSGFEATKPANSWVLKTQNCQNGC